MQSAPVVMLRVHAWRRVAQTPCADIPEKSRFQTSAGFPGKRLFSLPGAAPGITLCLFYFNEFLN
jgi:hypothetical protein